MQREVMIGSLPRPYRASDLSFQFDPFIPSRNLALFFRLDAWNPFFYYLSFVTRFFFVGIDDKDGQQACGLSLTVICADAVMIAR